MRRLRNQDIGTMMPSPPDHIVDLACKTAAQAVCQKSKRGVVVFETITRAMDPGLARDLVVTLGSGFNGPPPPIACDGSERCREDCPKLAVHAERRALDAALRRSPPGGMSACDLVHVKVDDSGELVPGGTPSCAECSKHILDLGMRGVWLFEETDCPSSSCPLCTGQFCMQCEGGCNHDSYERHKGRQPPQGEWHFYLSLEFHTKTLAHKRNRLYRGPILKGTATP